MNCVNIRMHSATIKITAEVFVIRYSGLMFWRVLLLLSCHKLCQPDPSKFL